MQNITKKKYLVKPKYHSNNMKKPFIIGEVSANHNGKIKQAKQIINLAKKSGLSAVKLQTYTPETMTINSRRKDFLVKNGIWKGFTLWDLYKKAQTPFEWQKELFNYAKKIGIKCFSTPFDIKALEVLEKINCPFYKVSSFEMTDLELISEIAKTKKNMIISTGLASLKEIEIAYNVAKKGGAKKISLLYCVSIYPASINDFHLENISILKKEFNCPVGLSDHSIDNKIALVAASLGAEIFEKHIALANQTKSPDIKFSLKGKKEIKDYINDVYLGQRLTKNKNFYRSDQELKGRVFRRSIYVVKDIKKGEKFSQENIKKIRPGHSLSALYYKKIIGKTSNKNLIFGDRIKKKNIKF